MSIDKADSVVSEFVTRGKGYSVDFQCSAYRRMRTSARAAAPFPRSATCPFSLKPGAERKDEIFYLPRNAEYYLCRRRLGIHVGADATVWSQVSPEGQHVCNLGFSLCSYPTPPGLRSVERRNYVAVRDFVTRNFLCFSSFFFASRLFAEVIVAR